MSAAAAASLGGCGAFGVSLSAGTKLPEEPQGTNWRRARSLRLSVCPGREGMEGEGEVGGRQKAQRSCKRSLGAAA